MAHTFAWRACACPCHFCFELLRRANVVDPTYAGFKIASRRPLTVTLAFILPNLIWRACMCMLAGVTLCTCGNESPACEGGYSREIFSEAHTAVWKYERETSSNNCSMVSMPSIVRVYWSWSIKSRTSLSGPSPGASCGRLCACIVLVHDLSVLSIVGRTFNTHWRKSSKTLFLNLRVFIKK